MPLVVIERKYKSGKIVTRKNYRA